VTSEHGSCRNMPDSSHGGDSRPTAGPWALSTIKAKGYAADGVSCLRAWLCGATTPPSWPCVRRSGPPPSSRASLPWCACACGVHPH
jgi:hypothetical protein